MGGGRRKCNFGGRAQSLVGREKKTTLEFGSGFWGVVMQVM